MSKPEFSGPPRTDKPSKGLWATGCIVVVVAMASFAASVGMALLSRSADQPAVVRAAPVGLTPMPSPAPAPVLPTPTPNAPALPSPNSFFDEVVVTGTLSEAAVRKQLASRDEAFERCAQASNSDDPQQTEISFTISKRGVPLRRPRTTGDEALGQCLAEVLRRIRFERAGGHTQVRLAKTLVAGEEGPANRPSTNVPPDDRPSMAGRRISAQIRSGSSDIRGSLSKEVIGRVMRRRQSAVRRCYEVGLRQNPDASGRVVVSFIIGARGNVTSSSIRSSTLNQPSVESCIAQAVRRMRFPEPDGGGIVVVNYPFLFRPG